MRKYRPPPRVKRGDKRTGDEYLREWAESLGSVRAAERASSLYPGHLKVLLFDPDRRGSPETMRKISRACGLPVEALVFRFDRICDLDFWKWVAEPR